MIEWKGKREGKMKINECEDMKLLHRNFFDIVFTRLSLVYPQFTRLHLYVMTFVNSVCIHLFAFIVDECA